MRCLHPAGFLCTFVPALPKACLRDCTHLYMASPLAGVTATAHLDSAKSQKKNTS